MDLLISEHCIFAADAQTLRDQGGALWTILEVLKETWLESKKIKDVIDMAGPLIPGLHGATKSGLCSLLRGSVPLHQFAVEADDNVDDEAGDESYSVAETPVSRQPEQPETDDEPVNVGQNESDEEDGGWDPVLNRPRRRTAPPGAHSRS